MPTTPVDKGKPVALVNVTEVGVPNVGAVSVGVVNVLLDKVSEPARVTKVPEVGKVSEVAPVEIKLVA